MQEQPAHIILFRHVHPENAQRLAQVLGATLLPDPAMRSTRTLLSTTNGVRARVYRALGVAVATLSPAQVTALSAEGNIVLPNEERRLPELQVQEADEPAVAAAETFAQIGLDPVRDGPTGQGVRVAVLDTGVDLHHPDLYVASGQASSFVPSAPTAHDDHGHGTHCAGVIAGKAVPAGGVRYGVAPGVSLLVAKVLDHRGRGTDDQIIDAIDWAVDQGAEIISMSLGSIRASGTPASARYEFIARRLLAQGVLLVAATGNESLRPGFVAPVGNPAACASVLGVAAVDHRDRIARFSSGNADGIGQVDLAAPGVGVLSAWPGGGVRRLSGTSMATPHVAAVAALHAEQDPALTGQTLWTRLTATARAVPGLGHADVGAGIVQAP